VGSAVTSYTARSDDQALRRILDDTWRGGCICRNETLGATTREWGWGTTRVESLVRRSDRDLQLWDLRVEARRSPLSRTQRRLVGALAVCRHSAGGTEARVSLRCIN